MDTKFDDVAKKKKFKLLCVDLDGTVLDNQHKLDERHRRVLKEVEEQGILTVLCTGRMHRDAADFAQQMGLQSPIISSNGALVVDQVLNEVLFKQGIESSHVWTVLNHAQEYGVGSNLMTMEGLYTNRIQSRLFWAYAKWRGFFSKKVPITYLATEKRWNRILEKEDESVLKCDLFSKKKGAVNKVQDALRTLHGLQLSRTIDGNLEVTAGNVSKGTAVQFLAEYYGFQQEEVLAIGDSENDLSMLEYAGFGIAMGNSVASVKEAADYITGANTEQGAIDAIKKFIFNE